MNTRKRLHCSRKTGAHYAVKTEADKRGKAADNKNIYIVQQCARTAGDVKMKKERAVSKRGVGAQMPTGHLKCDTS